MSYFKRLNISVEPYEEKWSGYHRRSLLETQMHRIKLLGDKLSARHFSRQINKIHAGIGVLNRLLALVKI